MNFEALLSDRLATALQAVAGRPVDAAVRRSQHADFQSGAALPLARVLRRAPRDVASDVLARADLGGIAVAEVSGPGFVNLSVDDGLVHAALAELAADGRLGVPLTTEPRTVVVDYSAPNVAKELHVGHLRSTVIGDAAARLLEWAGHRVVRANHLGDWGTPFGMLLEHLLETGGGEGGDLTAFYRAARARFDADPEFRVRARLRVVALQGGDATTTALWRRLVAQSESYFLDVYDRLGVTLTAGDFVGESFYQDMLADVVAELEDKGLVRVSDGALCAFPDGFTGRDGGPLPLIVRKSDGGFGYAATDLAALRHRVRELGASQLLYVVGTPQRMHFQMVYAVARAAGWLPAGVTATHIGFGSILGPDGRTFASRSGDPVKLADLLDTAEQRASALSADPLVARAVGVGALKYADLSGDRMSDYLFDWDRMLALTGNTGPYLQYAHARIRSILRKSGAAPGPVSLTDPAERALALELLAFPALVEQVVSSLELHRLAGQLYRVATTFSAFYERCPVRTAPPAVRDSRLGLCELTARVLRQGLGLLGIDTPERM
ncbi:arginine--tRNA ligase [Jidongwangia harbinensis]|uniref:arginine--tRNA ligase n=1 Tax=Jidongwangia harbinensis TaxID=2878561 RepID=UPI001CD9B81B|nr:arginine--tRNA ligase [Jidongwangia harbinensis]MCA2218449.1 arginine--tRNA ligase [Jidongwangia harbinensis]